MANRTTYPVSTPKSECEILMAKAVGAGAADLTISATNGEIVSATRTGVGTFDVVFRHKYPELVSAPAFKFVSSVSECLNGWFTALDVAAGTGTMKIYASAAPADPAATDTIYIEWAVRNSGRNS